MAASHATTNPRRLLEQIGVRPYRGWGQNFLIDPAVPERMVAAAGVPPDALVIEVGPGLGVLTEPLLATGARVTAVELDARLAGYLRERFAAEARLRLIEGDILHQTPDDLAPNNEPYAVIANLPYSVTSAVLRHLLRGPRRPTSITVMVQREVAERIVAPPPDMSLLAVSVQFFGQARLVMQVPAAAFFPAPKVDSAVVSLTVAPPALPDEAHAAFFRVVAAGFGQRRKTLLNSLTAGLALDRPTTSAALTAAGIDPLQRAQTLAVADWLRLYHTLAEPTATEPIP